MHNADVVQMHLYDVSVLATRAAYPNGTCVQARGIEIAYPEIPVEVRSAIGAMESTEERLVRQYGAEKVLDCDVQARPETPRLCDRAEGIFLKSSLTGLAVPGQIQQRGAL